MSEETAETVRNWDFDTIPAALKMEDLLDCDVAIFPTGQILEDDTYAASRDGELSEGFACHMVVRDPATGAVRFTDPLFPSIVWQEVMKKFVVRAYRRRKWTPMHVIKAKANKNGREPYIPVPITEQERKDALFTATDTYMRDEIGMAQDDPLSQLIEVEDAQIIAETRRPQIEGARTIEDAEVIDDTRVAEDAVIS